MKKLFTTGQLLLICIIMFAQNQSKPAEWSIYQDAVIAARENHKILLENDSVRVLQVTILPGKTEALHYHRWPSVLYVMEGENFIDRDSAGNVIFDSRKTPLPKPPLAMWVGPESLHSVENLSKKKAIRLIRVEIKR